MSVPWEWVVFTTTDPMQKKDREGEAEAGKRGSACSRKEAKRPHESTS